MYVEINGVMFSLTSFCVFNNLGISRDFKSFKNVYFNNLARLLSTS